jgi:hypothetical protein
MPYSSLLPLSLSIPPQASGEQADKKLQQTKNVPKMDVNKQHRAMDA